MLIYIGDDHGLIPGSRGLSFKDMLNKLNDINLKVDQNSKIGCNGELVEGNGYESLNFLEMAIACTLILKKTGIRILPNNPHTFTITR